MRNKPRPLTVAALRDRVDQIDHLRRLPFLTLLEVSLITGLSVSTIQRACASGALACCRAGRWYRVRPDAIDDWLTPSARRLERVK